MEMNYFKQSNLSHLLFLNEMDNKSRISFASKISDTFCIGQNPKSDESYPSYPFSAGDSLTIENFGQIYDGELYSGKLIPHPVGFCNKKQ